MNASPNWCDGKRALVDPVLSERPSPFTWAGPTRFHEMPLSIDEVPDIDAVVISHDHYDHLDHRTVQALGELTLTATPARHFSGRSLVMSGQDETLWCGWVISGRKSSICYRGDTGMLPGFTTISKRLGPLDAVLIQAGAYDQLWPDLHIGQEQAIEARVALGSGLFIPVHRGMFNLAMHAWTEPVERAIVAAKKAGVPIAVPRHANYAPHESGNEAREEPKPPIVLFRTQESSRPLTLRHGHHHVSA